MKNIGKKMIAAVVVFHLLAGIFSVPAKVAARDTYWLLGVSKAAGGQMRMYYKGDGLMMKGKIRKAASRNKVYEATAKKSTYTLKVAGNCKVVYVEADNNQTMTYKKWVKQRALRKGDEVSCIEAVFKVTDGKITRIYFSA